jgi:hypothetical protein
MAIAPFRPVTFEEAEKRLKVTRATLNRLIDSDLLPPPTTLGPGTQRKYWHPAIFYGRLDELLRTGALAALAAKTSKARNSRSGSEAETHHSPTNDSSRNSSAEFSA